MTAFWYRASVISALTVAGGLALLAWRWAEKQHGDCFVVFGASGATCEIVVPAAATAEERGAAEFLARTMTEAARGRAIFRIRTENETALNSRTIQVGQTAVAGQMWLPPSADRLVRPVGYKVEPRAVFIRAAHREDVFHAVSLFLEAAVRARWFMPGPLGYEVNYSPDLKLLPQTKIAAGKYYSRNLSGAAPGKEGEQWFQANRLNRLLTHGHTASQLASAAELAARPEFAPWLEDRRFVPQPRAVVNWQPDLLAPGFVEFIAAKATNTLGSEAKPLSFSFGQNDTYRFDQSERTLAALRPERYFRERPDYADLLFTFLNQLALPIGREFPDRYLTTYAYDWTENTPSFPVAANIVPYLTADRSGWFDENFAENDRALMARWGKSGVRFFALYDYLYGSPFIVPRPTVWAVSEPIPYAYAQGARAYYAEMTPNWALDGPKPWLAAQLLWDPSLEPGKLLDEYYARFWREAASPMRDFYELCDRQWRGQDKPAVWLKFFRDEEQSRLFPPAIRDSLRALLREADRRASSTVIRERVAFVAAAFQVTERFCMHAEENERLARLAFAGQATSAELIAAWRSYSEARDALVSAFAELKQQRPLAIQTTNLNDYLRNDPRQRVARLLASRGALEGLSQSELSTVFLGNPPQAATLVANGSELVKDGRLQTLAIKSRHPFFLTDWVEHGPWGGKSEPREHRQIQLLTNNDGSRRLRYSGCNQETLWQWFNAKPGAIYRASARVRGHVAPGTIVYLLVSMADQNGMHVDPGHTDRLPTGDWPDWVPLEVVVRAPANASWISINARTLYQVPGDWLEWELLSLKEIRE